MTTKITLTIPTNLFNDIDRLMDFHRKRNRSGYITEMLWSAVEKEKERVSGKINNWGESLD